MNRWRGFCENQDLLFPPLSSSPAELRAAHLPLSPPELPSSPRTLYLYHPRGLAVYITAIYNQLIHLWLFCLSLIKLLWWSAASCLISLMRVKKNVCIIKSPPEAVYGLQMFALLLTASLLSLSKCFVVILCSQRRCFFGDTEMFASV